MALKPCPGCGHNISDKARQCPHCAYELRREKQAVRNSSGSRPTQIVRPQPQDSLKIIPDPEPNRGMSKGVIAALITVGLLLIAATTGFFIYQENHKYNYDYYDYSDTLQTPDYTSSTGIPAAAPEEYGDTTKVAVETIPEKPLTQYFLVDKRGSSMFFRDADDMKRVLKVIGFTATVYDTSDCDYGCTVLKANRDGTEITLRFNGEDKFCDIRFASDYEMQKFIESLEASEWEYDGRLYSKGSGPNGTLYVRPGGKRVTIISPFEMLPSDF